MKVKEVSKAFGMNVKNFAVLCKCSRQSLYNAIECKAPVNGIKFNALLDRLQVISDDNYANDILKAMDQKAERDGLIRKLRGEKSFQVELNGKMVDVITVDGRKELIFDVAEQGEQ